jgi:glycosyltransferase involved in cell wall biosynthesis
MTRRLSVFYQHMPPYSSAAALRAVSVIAGLVGQRESAGFELRAYTTTPQPVAMEGVQVVTLGGVEVENAAGLAARMVGELRMGWAAARAMLAGAGPSDLLLVSTPSYLAALVICARARWRGVPYVLDVRDLYPQAYAEAGLVDRKGWLYRFFGARSLAMYLGARRIVAATQGLAREVAAAAPAASVHCVYNGFPAALASRRPVKHARFTACFHGVLGFFQDIDSLVEVARRVQAHGIDIVAIGYGRKEDALRAGVPDNLRFLGRLSFDDTITEVERCHVGLCLRLDDDISKDAFPVKVWEYLGLGMPSVVTPRCEAGTFLATHGCGFEFEAGAVDQIVQTLLRLRDQPGLRQGIEARCRDVASQYTRERLGLDAAALVVDARRAVRVGQN